MTKKLEFSDKIRQDAKQAGYWCKGCGVAGVPLQGDHIIPREAWLSGEFEKIAALVPALLPKGNEMLTDTSPEGLRLILLSSFNFQWLCAGCHEHKSRVDFKLSAVYRGTYRGDKPSFVVENIVSHYQDIFRKTLYTKAA